jgi:drug/metabolite transporter (DMT)-like permease
MVQSMQTAKHHTPATCDTLEDDDESNGTLADGMRGGAGTVMLPVLLDFGSRLVNCTNATSSSNSYDKPFFIAYTNSGAYAIFLIIFLLAHPELFWYFCAWLHTEIRDRFDCCCGNGEDGPTQRLLRTNGTASSPLDDELSPSPPQQRTPGGSDVDEQSVMAESLSTSRRLSPPPPPLSARAHQRHKRLQVLQAHERALPRYLVKLLPTYARSVRAAIALSVLYMLCGWLANASLSRTGLAVNTAIWNSGCALVFLFEGLFLPGHSLRDVQKLVSVAICLSGVALLTVASTTMEHPHDSSDSSTPTTVWGATYVLVAMVLYSGYEVLFKYVSEQRTETNEDDDATTTTADAGGIGAKGIIVSRSNSSVDDSYYDGGDTTSTEHSPRLRGVSFAPADELVLDVGAPAAVGAFVSLEASHPGSLTGGGLGVSDDDEVVVEGHSATMGPIWAAMLFLGSIGMAILLVQWVGLFVLHYTGVEEWETPHGNDLQVILASMALDCVLNIAILGTIAFSTALFLQCGVLLTIPTSTLWDYFAHHAVPSALTLVGIGVLVVGFLGLNLKFPCWKTTEEREAEAEAAAEAAIHGQEAEDDEADLTSALARKLRPLGRGAATAGAGAGAGGRGRASPSSSLGPDADADDEYLFHADDAPRLPAELLTSPHLAPLHSHLLAEHR